jgi:putative aldouronate transport system permease protein
MLQPMVKQRNLWRKRLKRQKALQFMVLPGVVWMIIFSYIPMAFLVFAFFHFDLAKPMTQAPFVGTAFFLEFLKDPRFWRVMQNTLGISFWKLAVGFPLPIIFALFLNEISRTGFKRTVQTISYLPHFISWTIFGGILLSWLSERGLFNQLLIGLGLQRGDIPYIAMPQYFWTISVVSDVWKELGWSAVIYIAAISAINPELYQAADIDGANRYQKMWHVTLQGIRPTIAVLFILAVAGLLGSNFDQVFVLKNSMNLRASETIDLYVYNMGIVTGRFSYSTAVSLARSLFSLALLLTANYVTGRLTGEAML